MIKTREEINLKVIRGSGFLENSMIMSEVEYNDDTRQAVLDLHDPQLAYFYALYVMPKGEYDPEMYNLLKLDDYCRMAYNVLKEWRCIR